MKVELFDFELPAERIATRPVTPRDEARLLLVESFIAPEQSAKTVRDLPSIINSGDILVFNNTKVIPARLTGKRGDATIEVTLLKKYSPDTWAAFAKPAKRLRIGDTYQIADDFSALVKDKLATGEVVLQFDCGGEALSEKLNRYGSMPLPPYMKRHAQAQDNKDYQTIYAKHEGAVAAPTAGLHFTSELLAALDAKGIKRTEVTLHVGAGTFLPVKVDDTKDHVMHSEEISITQEAADAIHTARAAGGRVVAIGTTALRLLESIADDAGNLKAFHGDTQIFITPGYRFKIVDLLFTNFHLPRSTLFMLVSAFAGLETMHRAYQYAIQFGYRFYSYGDACLLKREQKK